MQKYEHVMFTRPKRQRLRVSCKNVGAAVAEGLRGFPHEILRYSGVQPWRRT